MNKKPLFKAIVTGFVAGIILYGVLAPQVIHADMENSTSIIDSATLVKNGKLTICKLDKTHFEVVKVIKGVVFTAYSSTADQTDDSPFLTAWQTPVRDGVIAMNGMPFGTKVRIPKLYGDKVFTIEDRMNSKYNGKNRADIWFPGEQAGKREAFKFGVQKADMEIIAVD